jgi:hypothetical protein
MADMKLAHYLHIPPRMVFLAQGLATFIGALVQCGVTVYMVTRVPDVCASDNQDGYTCPHGRVTYSASLIWGLFSSPLIGPPFETPFFFVVLPQAYSTSTHCSSANQFFFVFFSIIYRSPRSRQEFLSRPVIRQSPLVLLSWTNSCRPYLVSLTTMERFTLDLLAGCLWGHVTCTSCYRSQFLSMVASEHDL